MHKDSIKLGIISGMPGLIKGDCIFIHLSFGRIIDELASRVEKCYLCIPLHKNIETADYQLQANNITMIAQPAWRKTFQGLKYFVGIFNAGRKIVDSSDVIFIRGTLPYLAFIYIYAIFKRKKIIQWLVGNPTELLRIAPRSSGFMERLAYIYAWAEELWLKMARWFPNIFFLVNGCELYKKYKGIRTQIVVSSTISENDFYYRKDTCLNDPIRILFVGFIRPEKGLIYLIEAISCLTAVHKLLLVIVGDTKDYPAETRRIIKRIEELKLQDRVVLEGYKQFGPELFEYFKKSDIFILPTLSEGTPRVLVEARANSLPIIATNVGGIPTSVTNGFDGILVPPKDSDALADAIGKIIEDGEFRRSLIRNGYQTVKKYTVNHFVDLVCDMF